MAEVDTRHINVYTRSVAPPGGGQTVTMSERTELYLISMAADLLDMHPQTLRKYERLGLVRPQRTLGSMRVYTREELDRLRLIKTLVDEGGINLAGVRRLLKIAEVAGRMRPLAGGMASGAAGDVHSRLVEELNEIFRLLGLD
jgi:MerR family transcriptional regulator/heat shock protein HspR